MNPDFKKYANGLIPAIIQDAETNIVLMLGFMNEEAYNKTIELNRVTFYSRSKKRLWTKGEESGNYLQLKSISIDCDNDAFLIKAKPNGFVCHTGADTCWGEKNNSNDFLLHLQTVINERKKNPSEKSYTSSLFANGINKIAQKVGEEATELVIEAKDSDDEKFKNEAADLLFHYLVLLSAKNVSLLDVITVLKNREK